jgi:NDP-sugar pyrophosphorylase family protein
LKVGTKKTTGQHYQGHFSIWLTNDIQEKHTFLHDKFNLTPTFTTGWVNGNLYTLTSEVLGILPIADGICSSLGMAEYIPSLHRNEVAPQYRFLAELQGT